VVRLSVEEREQLERLIRKGRGPARRLLKARILLKADISEAGDGWSDSDGSEDPWTTGVAMTIARSVADVLRNHVVLEYEAIDRMYLNVYVPHLKTVGAIVGYLRVHHGQRFAPTRQWRR
jgi:hypothetical protein